MGVQCTIGRPPLKWHTAIVYTHYKAQNRTHTHTRTRRETDRNSIYLWFRRMQWYAMILMLYKNRNVWWLARGTNGPTHLSFTQWHSENASKAIRVRVDGTMHLRSAIFVVFFSFFHILNARIVSYCIHKSYRVYVLAKLNASRAYVLLILVPL